MPPGNNNAKPAPRGKCAYCRKESCRGDNCKVVTFEGVCGNAFGDQVKYSSVTTDTFGRRTYSTSQTSEIGTVVSSSRVQQPVDTLLQSNATSTNITTSNPTPAGTVPPARVPWPVNTLQQSNATAKSITTSISSPAGTIVPPARVQRPVNTLQQSNATATSITTSIPTPAGTIVPPAKVPRPVNTLQQSNATATSITTSIPTPAGTVVPRAIVPQPENTPQQSNATPIIASTGVPEKSNTLHFDNKIQQWNANDKYNKTTTFQGEPLYFSQASNDSKPKTEVMTVKSHFNVLHPELKQNEQGMHKNMSGTVHLSSSTDIASANASVLAGVKSDSVVPKMPASPDDNKVFLEKLGIIMRHSLPTTSDYEKLPILEVNRTDIKEMQNRENKVKDEIKPLVSSKINCASIISESTSNSDMVDETIVNKPKSRSQKYEGVVFQILGSRNARVRVAERNGIPLQKSEWGAADAEHKYALLLVDKLKQSDNGSSYPKDTPINSVLNKGDIVNVVCTANNKPNNTFQLFVQMAQRTGQNSQINDADSVASYCSQTGSETKESKSSNTKKNRPRKKKAQKKEVQIGDSHDVNVAVSQWLDKSECSQNSCETSKTLKLIAGCPYIGKVIEMRLPYAFIVEVSSNTSKQLVFVFSNHFHLQGISSPAMAHGVSLESFVNIGDEIVVIPNKNTSVLDNKFEWVASKAWPKTIQSPTSYNLNCSNKYEALTSAEEKISHQGDENMEKADQQGEMQTMTYVKSLYPLAKTWKELDGIILSLQYDWGIVKAVRDQSAYIFTRKNTYLFGVSLEHFFLDDVLQEGQFVQFSLESEKNGDMNALAVCHGSKLPYFNSFEVATSKYCEERNISFSVESSLVQHGKLLYFGK